MPRCPNCGRETLRTEDWACQWCGIPLLSGAFKKIPKTYRELQEERSFEMRPVLEDEPAPAPVAEVEVEPVPRAPEPELEAPPVPEPQPPPMPDPEPEIAPATPAPPEPVAEVQAESEIEPSPEPEDEPVVEEKPIAEAEPVAVAEVEDEAEPASEPVTEIEPEVEAAPATEPVAATALEPDPATGAISATVEGLNASFNSDKVGTNNKLLNKVLQVTGTVEKVFAKDHLDIFYIILAGAGGPSTRRVRCTFSREHGTYLSRLTDGQTATVQGTYVGYERNIILKECGLV
jgi:hypothetical protein